MSNIDNNEWTDSITDGLPERSTLVVMFKRPRPGQGKQRLASTLGTEQTHRVAEAMLNCVLEDASIWPGNVVFSPSDPADTRQGTALVSIASVSGATLAFLVGCTLAREAIERKINRMPKFDALDKALHRNGFLVVLLTRLSPFFPFNLLNYAYGLTSVSLRSYLVASWIGMLPGTVFYVYVGSLVNSLTQVFHEEVETDLGGRVLFVTGLIATVLTTLLLTRMASRTLRAQLESN